MLGHNGLNSDRIMDFVHSLESCAERHESIADEEKAIFLSAKTEGFNKLGIRAILKARKAKPHEYADKRAVESTYLAAVGMGDDLPLFRQMGALAKDLASRDSIIEAMMQLAPMEGEIIVKMSGGEPVRIFRDKAGKPQAEDYSNRQAPLPMPKPDFPAEAPTVKRDVPDVTEDQAEELGRLAARENVPIVKNPFPFGDARRQRWDQGWCDENGSDGMGPGKKD